MAGKLIVLEGLSAVGKTTVANLLAKQLGAVLVDTVPAEFDELRQMVCQQNSIDVRYILFLAAIVSSSQTVMHNLQSGLNVVCESFIYRTIAFHRGMGSQLDYRISKGIPTPDFVFHLTCRHDERRQRLFSREKAITKWDLLAEEAADRILHEYNAFRMLEIDTTSISISELVAGLTALVENNEDSQSLGRNQDLFPIASLTSACV